MTYVYNMCVRATVCASSCSEGGDCLIWQRHPYPERHVTWIYLLQQAWSTYSQGRYTRWL